MMNNEVWSMKDEREWGFVDDGLPNRQTDNALVIDCSVAFAATKFAQFTLKWN